MYFGISPQKILAWIALNLMIFGEKSNHYVTWKNVRKQSHCGGFHVDLEIYHIRKPFLRITVHCPNPQRLPTAFDIHRNWSRTNLRSVLRLENLQGADEAKAEQFHRPFHLLSWPEVATARGSWLLELRRVWLQGVRQLCKTKCRRVPALVQFYLNSMTTETRNRENGQVVRLPTYTLNHQNGQICTRWFTAGCLKAYRIPNT